MKISANYLFDFFLPRFCPGCKKKLTAEAKPICKECIASILLTNEKLLEREFNRKFSSTKVIKDFYSKFVFENDKELQHIIHALKYNKKFRVGIYLGELLAESLKQQDWQIDLIIPVPIHHLKKAERGYNQSDFIVKGLSKGMKIPYSLSTIKRVRFTETQTDLNLNERAKNVENAFKLRKPKKLKGKNILLVDDVITTGATILECAKVLVNYGAKTVYACSVGIAE